MKVNLNADMGEGFGAYDIGNDAALLDIVATANVACGMHGGDPSVMVRVTAAAAAKGVSVGAHPGFNDLWGFGRRKIEMSATDLEALVAYQIGALQALARAAGTNVTHVKAHGALNNMACVRADYARAIATAIVKVDRSLIHLVMPGTEMETASRAADLPTALEAFVDRSYEADGTLTPRGFPGAVLHDADAAAARAVKMVQTGTVVARTGETVPLTIHSLCVHGDEPSAVATARATRRALDEAGITIAPLPAMVGA